ncbi:putative Clathrin adaptor complex small chain Adaptor complexes medium subunit family [Trypanosoma vivax]|uniref:Putative adaptor complex AP-1 medium subunit n=1 Tax=Trypanosoma vivax (strain Y486) TaxID=1055687 RepID=G0TYC4_TRYVY|nr:putative adaptor complex AP-1 medium subunit [Trypanosoma vivax]KAH8619671.1 putative Clathrin adaptor complex small chain Adaptor complexes medium subunit family [Trypanosoma vivax]CCC48971.1 putative adaptor complex AP-1 medium subunit [Trypanosoma vivax Y486]
MASVLYILDSKGSPLICRSYRGDVAQHPPAVFQRRVLDEEEARVCPVFEEQGHTYCFIHVNNVYLLMVSKVNICPLQQIAFLRRCVTVFESYFKHVLEESIMDNFVIVYELLDEMCDFGLPQYTEEKVLKKYITQGGLISYLMPEELKRPKELPAAASGTAGDTPWRQPGKYKYRKNEVFLDVIESVSLLVSPRGETLSSEIVGQIKMRVRLSGMPVLRLGLNDKAMFDVAARTGHGVELEGVKLHQCVQLSQFESHRIISFIPPDGEFELMSYRSSRKVAPMIHVESTVISKSATSIEMIVEARTTYRRNLTAAFIDIMIPVPSDAYKPEGRCSMGKIRHAPESNMIIWALQGVGGGKQFNCLCKLSLPSVRSSDPGATAKAPIQVKFEVPYLTASGIQVRYLKVTEESNYSATPWVRYVTQSGDYQIRTG